MDDVKRLGTAVRKLLEYDAKIRKEILSSAGGNGLFHEAR